MKIKSNFKDYYDYIAHLYGGGDPKVTYPRVTPAGTDQFDIRVVNTETSPLDYNVKKAFAEKPALHPNLPELPDCGYYRRRKPEDPNFQWLVVVDRVFLLVSYDSLEADRHVITTKDLDDHVLRDVYLRRSTWRDDGAKEHNDLLDKREVPPDYIGKQYTSVLSLTRLVGEPVYVVRDWKSEGSLRRGGGKDYFNIETRLPKLGELGVPAYLPADQIYQEIAYYIGNLAHGSPDADPPVEVDNKTKIEKAGFDLKTSFRHPVK